MKTRAMLIAGGVVVAAAAALWMRGDWPVTHAAAEGPPPACVCAITKLEQLPNSIAHCRCGKISCVIGSQMQMSCFVTP